MAMPPKKPNPTNPKFGGQPVRNKPKPANMPQPKNLTPPNATGIKTAKKKKASGSVSAGTGRNGLYW